MKDLKKYLLPSLGFAVNLLSALFWVAMRVIYSGISKVLGAETNPSFLVMNLPVLICVLAWVGATFALAGLFLWNRRKWPAVTGIVIGLITTVGACAVVALGGKDYLRFILVHFWESLAVTGAILVLAGALLLPRKNTPKTLAIKALVLVVAILVAVVLGYGLKPWKITQGAVVYAVEDQYQIVFSTSDSAIAWVDIGGETFYDLYAGSMRSVDRVHKIEVPQSVLDAAGGYTVYAQQMIYRGPFGGYTGTVLSESYGFRPVDPSDGLSYYALSDVHEAVDAAAAAAGSGEDLDFLVMLGDLVSMVETEADVQLANQLAHAVTGGEIPVIYARGNHEVKGEMSEELYKYVGSRDQQYAYYVTLSDTVFALVLDLGEDHEDDWWEYYGTAQFDIYRQQQTDMLEQLLEAGDYAAYPYRMALCHIPIACVEYEYFASFRQEWTRLLNEMDVDISLSGHVHELWQMIPGTLEPNTQLSYAPGYRENTEISISTWVTDHDFPAFVVGRRSLTEQGGTQKDGDTDFVGLVTEVNLEEGWQESVYRNSLGQEVTGYYAFAGTYDSDTYTRICTPLQ